MDERKFFPKSERLCLQKEICRLFNTGKSFVSFPLRIVYLTEANKSGISVLISVPKKRLKDAVQRNRIKRLIRESFRNHKNDPSEHFKLTEKQLLIAFMYISCEMKPYTAIEKAVLSALTKIKRLETNL